MKFLSFLYVIMFVAIPFTLYNFPKHLREVSFYAIIIGVVFQVAFIFFQKKKALIKIEDRPLDPAFDGIKFDYDFSKVPAGDENIAPNQIPNYLNPSIFKEFDENLKENLERIGLKDENESKKN